MHEDRRGIASGVAAYLLWGLLTVYWKQLHGLPAVQLIAMRVVCSSVLLAVGLSVVTQWQPLLAALRDSRQLLRLSLAAVLLSANWMTYVWAVGHDRVTETALGYFIAPLLTMLIGIVKYHERVSALQRAALALAGIALVVLVIGYGEVPVVALGLAGTWSVYGVLKRQIALTPLQSLGGETLVLTIPAVIFLAIEGGRGQLLSGATHRQVFLVLLAGVVTAIPLLLFGRAAQTVPFTILGPLNYLVPTINFLLGVIAYHEEFDALRFVGFGFVWASLALIALNGIRAARPTQLAGARA